MNLNTRVVSTAIAGVLLGIGTFSMLRAAASETVEPIVTKVCNDTCKGLPDLEKNICLSACNDGAGDGCKTLGGSSESSCLSCCSEGIVGPDGNRVGGCIEAVPSTPAGHANWEACVQGCRAGCSGKKPGPLPTTPDL